MSISEIGFGCYRIDISIKEHYDALYKALTSGINVVDTSSNYSDGGSEELVGNVLRDLISENKLNRNELTLITKGGYIQGQNYKFAAKLKTEGKPFEDVTEFTEGLWHCISPDFLEDQINRQLFRLDQEYIDIYLLHNPEYYLGWAKENKIDKSEANEIYYKRIKKAFEFLESKVSEGRILSYGISSNTFVVPSGEYDFTSLEKVFEIAKSISDKHHFKTIQFPLNLFECGAVTIKNQEINSKTVLEFAEEKGLTVFINRPLNAVTSKGLVRLSDFKWEAFQEKDFFKQLKLVSLMEDDLLNEKIPNEDPDKNIDEKDIATLKKLLTFGNLIEENWKYFGSIEHYNDVITQLLAPKISRIITIFDEKVSDPDLKDFSARYIRECYRLLNFVSNYYKMKADKRSKFIHSLIDKNLDPEYKDLTLSQKTLLILRSVAGVNCILTGIRREVYVDDVLAVLNSEKIKNAKEIIQFVSKEIEYSDA